MSGRPLRLLIVVLALLGVGISAYLTYARYSDAALACTTGGCETVQSSRYSEVLGVPVAVLGLVGYLLILATAARDGIGFRTAGASLATAGFAFSLYLLFLQLVVINAVCLWCVASEGVMTLLFAASLLRLWTDRTHLVVSAG